MPYAIRRIPETKYGFPDELISGVSEVEYFATWGSVINAFPKSTSILQHMDRVHQDEEIYIWKHKREVDAIYRGWKTHEDYIKFRASIETEPKHDVILCNFVRFTGKSRKVGSLDMLTGRVIIWFVDSPIGEDDHEGEANEQEKTRGIYRGT